MADKVVEFPRRIDRPAHLKTVQPLTDGEDEQWVKDMNRKCLRAHLRNLVRIFGSFEAAKAEVLAALADTEADGRGI